VTRAVQKAFDDALHGRTDRYREWLDPVPLRERVA
jgi:branched-chain amino acid aminotransferase